MEVGSWKVPEGLPFSVVRRIQCFVSGPTFQLSFQIMSKSERSHSVEDRVLRHGVLQACQRMEEEAHSGAGAIGRS